MQADDNVPSGYEKVQSLDFSNGAYVETDIIFGVGVSVIGEVYVATGTDRPYFFFGWGNISNYTLCSNFLPTPPYGLQMYVDSVNWTPYVVCPLGDQWVTMEVKLRSNNSEYSYIKINEDYICTGNIATPYFYVNLKVLIYNRANRITSGSRVAYSIKKTDMYDASGDLVGHFIPCKRLSDNVYGLYNTITKTFCAGVGSIGQDSHI